jgi:hypothetical protein
VQTISQEDMHPILQRQGVDASRLETPLLDSRRPLLYILLQRKGNVADKHHRRSSGGVIPEEGKGHAARDEGGLSLS